MRNSVDFVFIREQRDRETFIAPLNAEKSIVHFLVAVIFCLLALIEDTEHIVLDGVFFLLNDLSAVQTLPAFKIYEVVEKGLHDH